MIRFYTCTVCGEDVSPICATTIEWEWPSRKKTHFCKKHGKALKKLVSSPDGIQTLKRLSE